jgi:hypothetical protein
MSLEIVQREQEGISIVDLKGHLTFGPGDSHFRSELDSPTLRHPEFVRSQGEPTQS